MMLITIKIYEYSQFSAQPPAKKPGVIDLE